MTQSGKRSIDTEPKYYSRRLLAAGFAGGLMVGAIVGPRVYDILGTDPSSTKIEFVTDRNPTTSATEEANHKLPKTTVTKIDPTEIGIVVSNAITESTGEMPGEQGAHKVTVTIEPDGDIAEAAVVDNQ